MRLWTDLLLELRRVLYQPTLVPLPAARAATPPDLRILSLFGWTLGGAFVVDWPASPVGPYWEVAVLSALVVRDFGIGAWASHIVVTAQPAAAAARELFGYGRSEVLSDPTQAAPVTRVPWDRESA